MAVEDTTSTDAENVVDTSVSEDTSTVDDDGDLEDIEVDLADIQSEDDEEEQAEESEPEDTEATDEPSEDESNEEESEPSDEQKQAAHNKAMYDQRQQEKQARIDRVRSEQQAYIQDGAENADPLELAVRQVQVNQYNTTVEATTNRLTNSYERALTDFPVLKTSDPIVQAEIDQAIDAFQAMNVTIDGYGNPVDVRGDLYATLQAKADSIEKLTGLKVKQQESNKSKEKSKAMTVPSRAAKQAKVDPDMAAFDEEADW